MNDTAKNIVSYFLVGLYIIAWKLLLSTPGSALLKFLQEKGQHLLSI